MAPGDVLVLVALETVIEGVVAGPVVDVDFVLPREGVEYQVGSIVVHNRLGLGSFGHHVGYHRYLLG